MHAILRARSNVWQAGSVSSEPPGLRERKKQATQKALREAALRLALDHPTIEMRPGVLTSADEAGVVRHALGAHLTGPLALGGPRP